MTMIYCPVEIDLHLDDKGNCFELDTNYLKERLKVVREKYPNNSFFINLILAFPTLTELFISQQKIKYYH